MGQKTPIDTEDCEVYVRKVGATDTLNKLLKMLIKEGSPKV